MNRMILLTLFSGLTILSFAQNSRDENDLKTLVKADLGLQGLGFTFEPRLSKKISMDLSLGAGGGYNVSEDRVEYGWSIPQPAFYFSATPKFFYNRRKRIEQGKTTKLNSGNYIGLRLKYTTASIASNDDLRDAFLVNLHYGIQREIGGRWLFNAHAGGGYARDRGSQFGAIYPALDLKFSYSFTKR